VIDEEREEPTSPESRPAAGDDAPPTEGSGTTKEEPVPAEEPAVPAEEPAVPAEEPAAPATEEPEEPAAEEPAIPEAEAEGPAAPAAAEGAEPAAAEGQEPGPDQPDAAAPPRQRPPQAAKDADAAPTAIPGADLVPDIVPEGFDPLSHAEDDGFAEDLEPVAEESVPAPDDEEHARPIAQAAIDLASGARYRATGKRKTAVARVILRPGSGSYLVNGRTLDEYFPRPTLQRNIRQPLETVGYQDRMDIVVTLHGGGVSSQAGALRHGISRALLEADPGLRTELKRRGFLTRDSRAKERRKAGLKKARKKPQFSKR